MAKKAEESRISGVPDIGPGRPAEGTKVVNGGRHLDSVEKRIDRLGERIEKLDARVNDVSTTVNAMKGTLDAWKWMVPVAVVTAGIIATLVTRPTS